MSPSWISLLQSLLLYIGEVNVWLEEGNRIILQKADGSTVTLSKSAGEKLKVTVLNADGSANRPPGAGEEPSAEGSSQS